MPQREDYLLRPMIESDLEQVLEWRNSDRIRGNMYTDRLISIEEHTEWLKKVIHDDTSIYKIFEFQNRAIGVANAVQIDRQNSKCIWAFYLGCPNTPNGSGAIMEYLFLEELFEKINIRKLNCEVFEFNASTIKLHKKFGFQQEGLFKKEFLKNGKYENVVRLALFREEWLSTKEKMRKICFR